MPENAASPAMTFPQISDYAFLSDCEANCLIAPDGSVEWMCIPRPDSASIFTAMLDRGAGSFGVGPVGVTVPNARRYIPGTLVLETTWQTPTGWLVVRDAMVVAPWHDVDQRSGSHRRAPTDNDALHCLVRVLECTYGSVDVSASCEPVFGYGTVPPEWTYRDSGYHDLQATAQRRSGEMGPHPQEPTLGINSSLRFGVEGRTAIARTRMTAGEKHFVAFSFSAQDTPRSVAAAEGRVEHTVEFWREWLTQGTPQSLGSPAWGGPGAAPPLGFPSLAPSPASPGALSSPPFQCTTLGIFHGPLKRGHKAWDEQTCSPRT